ncbi:MAG: SAM-dependent methyltransferase [Burkholderiales bacterium]|nr:SAM-dependent methyltransferase [Burkholderiales bacterium]
MPVPRPPSLPEPDAVARLHSERVRSHVATLIAREGGWITIERYLREVLYAPGLGYYVAGARKFGAEGDFVTAPEMTPLYGAALAGPLATILAASARREIVELGAGSGALARSLIAALAAAGAAPARYRIVEVSPELKLRQQAALADVAIPLDWCSVLPESIDGAIVLNEVLDALPPHVVVRCDGVWYERGVTLAGADPSSGAVTSRRDGSPGVVRNAGPTLALADRPLADAALRELAATRFPPEGDYTSEINPAAEALVATLASRLGDGAIVIADYGFAQAEYYHPQRTMGTLVAHYRHRVHADPLLWPGLTDLTAHVDFTAMAQAAQAAGLHVAGYTSQAAFLVAAGILDHLARVGPPESVPYLREAAAVQRLLSPAEMGELFKILILARDDGIVWRYLADVDRSHRL